MNRSEVIFEALQEPFENSEYLHSVGSGDVAAIGHIVSSVFFDCDEDSEILDLLTGAIMARAFCDLPNAYQAAITILEHEKAQVAIAYGWKE